MKDSTVFDNENKEPFVWAKNYSITAKKLDQPDNEKIEFDLI